MPNVVSVLTKEEHTALKIRASEASRTLGNQLKCEAFGRVFLPTPKKRTRRAAK